MATEQQAIGRCFRLGATKPVTVHRIVVRGPSGEGGTHGPNPNLNPNPNPNSNSNPNPNPNPNLNPNPSP